MEEIQKYYELNRKKAQIEKELKELKNMIREEVELGKTEIGEFEVSRAMRTRIDLDKKEVLTKLGQDAYNECEKISEYEVLTIKKI